MDGVTMKIGFLPAGISYAQGMKIKSNDNIDKDEDAHEGDALGAPDGTAAEIRVELPRALQDLAHARSY
jgi:hypothetical protein